MKFLKSTISTPSRFRLAEIIAAGERIDESLDTIRGAKERLTATTTAGEHIRQQIDRLDAIETAAVLEAAREGREPPEPDGQRRAALTKELESAVAREAAAKRALPSLEAELVAEAGKRPGIEKAKSAAIAEIMVEEVESFVDEFAATVAKFTAQMQAIGEVREMILSAVEAGGDRGGYIALEGLDAKMKTAAQRPITDTAAIRARWLAFMADLAVDAGATLPSPETALSPVEQAIRARNALARSAPPANTALTPLQQIMREMR